MTRLVGCLALTACLSLAACSAESRLHLPPKLAGQMPPDYRLSEGRGVILARFTVTTQGQPGFGAITNPLLVELREVGEPGAWGTPDATPQGLSLPSPDARVWTSARDVPTLWEYRPPGLMAASFRPGTYDGLVMAYPDTLHKHIPDSIPAPSQGMRFQPIEVPADTVVYVGTIDIRQHYDFWDWMLDRVQVEFSVRDDYEQTVAEFRSQYPQFRDTPVQKRLAEVVPPVL